MAEDMAIEETVMTDVQSLLDAASLVTHRDGEDLGKNPSYAAPGRVAISADIAGSSLDGGQIPAGFPAVNLILTAETHLSKDPTGSAVNIMAKLVREVIEVEELVANLNAEAGIATYFARQQGRAFRDDEGRIRRLVMTHTLIMRPSN